VQSLRFLTHATSLVPLHHTGQSQITSRCPRAKRSYPRKPQAPPTTAYQTNEATQLLTSHQPYEGRQFSSTVAITQSPPKNYDLDSRPTDDLGVSLCSDFHGLRGIDIAFVSRDLASATILFKSLSNLAASSRLIRRISSLMMSIVNSPRVHLANK
jgi:hypothetical protein